jgi:RNA polymerase sigma-70 factor
VIDQRERSQPPAEQVLALRRDRQDRDVAGDSLVEEEPRPAPVLGDEGEAALEAASARLPARQRTILRLHYVDGLTVDQIGAIYGFHRATAARRIADARDDLLEATREELRGKLRISDSDFDSLVRLVRSQIEISLPSFLATPDE